MKEHSTSKWTCHNHGERVVSQDNVTYTDIEFIGTPICPECGDDMQFDSERWVKEGG